MACLESARFLKNWFVVIKKQKGGREQFSSFVEKKMETDNTDLHPALPKAAD
jgi:hypothetical protein